MAGESFNKNTGVRYIKITDSREAENSSYRTISVPKDELPRLLEILAEVMPTIDDLHVRINEALSSVNPLEALNKLGEEEAFVATNAQQKEKEVNVRQIQLGEKREGIASVYFQLAFCKFHNGEPLKNAVPLISLLKAPGIPHGAAGDTSADNNKGENGVVFQSDEDFDQLVDILQDQRQKSKGEKRAASGDQWGAGPSTKKGPLSKKGQALVRGKK